MIKISFVLLLLIAVSNGVFVYNYNPWNLLQRCSMRNIHCSGQHKPGWCYGSFAHCMTTLATEAPTTAPDTTTVQYTGNNETTDSNETTKPNEDGGVTTHLRYPPTPFPPPDNICSTSPYNSHTSCSMQKAFNNEQYRAILNKYLCKEVNKANDDDGASMFLDNNSTTGQAIIPPQGAFTPPPQPPIINPCAGNFVEEIQWEGIDENGNLVELLQNHEDKIYQTAWVRKCKPGMFGAILNNFYCRKSLQPIHMAVTKLVGVTDVQGVLLSQLQVKVALVNIEGDCMLSTT